MPIRPTYLAAALLSLPLTAQTFSNPTAIIGEVGVRRTTSGTVTFEQTLTGTIAGSMTIGATTVPGALQSRTTMTQTGTSFSVDQYMQTESQLFTDCETLGGLSPAQVTVPQLFTGTLSASQPTQGAIYVRSSHSLQGQHTLLGRVSVLGHSLDTVQQSGWYVAAFPVTLDAAGVTWTIEMQTSAHTAGPGTPGGHALARIEVGFSTDRCYEAVEQLSCYAGGNHGIEISGPNGDVVDFKLVTGPSNPNAALLLSPIGATIELPLSDAPRCHLLAFTPIALPATVSSGGLASVVLTVPPTHIGSIRSQFVTIVPWVGIPKPSNTRRLDCVF